MYLTCRLCGESYLQSDELQAWNDSVKEHFLICAIRSIETLQTRVLPINKANTNFRAGFVVHWGSNQSCMITVSLRDGDNRWRVKNGGGLTTIQTSSFSHLIDHLRIQWHIPIP